MIRPRRLLAGAATALAVTLGVTGCDATPYAANVGSTTIKQAALDNELHQLASSTGYVSFEVTSQHVQVNGAAKGSFNTPWVSQVLSDLIQLHVLDQYLAAHGQQTDPAVAAAVRGVLESELGGTWLTFPASWRDTIVALVADESMLTPISKDKTTLASGYAKFKANLFTQVCVRQIAVTVTGPGGSIDYPKSLAAAQAIVAQYTAAGGSGTPADVAGGSVSCYSQQQLEGQAPALFNAVQSLQTGAAQAPQKTPYGYSVLAVDSRQTETETPAVDHVLTLAVAANSLPVPVETALRSVHVKVNPQYGAWSTTGLAVVPPGGGAQPVGRAVPRIVVVGLGPGDPGLVTAATLAALERIPRRYLRTERHPSAHLAAPAATFDAVYEGAEALEDVYPAIVAALVGAAAEHGEVLYAVPGSPLVAERSVQLLRAAPGVEVEVLPGLSFLDLAFHRLGVDPVAAGVRLVDGHRFATEAAGQPGPLLVGQCDTRFVLSEIKLAVDDGPDAVILHHLGLPDERVVGVPWADLDRTLEPDHLTTVWIPVLAEPVAAEVARFDELVHTLRARCPWDREQTHHSLTRHLLEETYEVLEAIDELAGDADAGYAHLEEELGDLLFQVVFHATLAAEEGRFGLADVARGIREKLVRRHPHVFGGPPRSWEEIKRAEKGRRSVMDGVPGNLPSLLYAHKVQYKAAALGFDWKDLDGPWAKLGEELAELRVAVDHDAAGPAVHEELGDVLFTVVNLARHLHLDPEAALRDAAAKFRRRMAAVEALAEARGIDLAATDEAGLDVLWQDVKHGGGAVG